MDENGNYEQPVAFSRRLRRQCTTPELILWDRLKNSMAGFKFSRQIRISDYTVDFCCRSRKLIVELDGEAHEANEAWDAQRESDLRTLGYDVIRFKNDEVRHQLDRVLTRIAEACERREQYRY